MMTIEQYRKMAEGKISYPRNGSGFELPQLVDDVWESREILKDVRRSLVRKAPLTALMVTDAICRLDRILNQLEIER